MSDKKENKLIIMMFVIYMFSYLGKYSYSSNIVSILSSFSITKQQTGLVASMFFFTYGAGQIINGLLCKKYNRKYVILISLSISAILNFLIYIGIDFIYYKYLWLINGFILSILWPTIILFISENIKIENFKKVILVLGFTTPLGTALAYGMSSLNTFFNNYKLTFLFSALILLFTGLYWIIFYNKNFKNAKENIDNNQNEVELFAKEPVVQSSNSEGTDKTKIKIVKTSFLLSFIFLSIFMILNSIVRDGLSTWMPSILSEMFNLSNSFSIFLTIGLPFMGILGIYISILTNNKVKNSVYLCGIFYSISFLMLAVINLILNSKSFVIIILMTLIISSSHGIANVITGIFPLYNSKKLNAGLISGILNGLGYLGAAISTYILGKLSDNFGWQTNFVVLLVICAIPIILSITYFLVKKLNKHYS